MDVCIGLASLVGLSLFLARQTGHSPSIMPLVSVALGMMWFTLFACFNLLVPAGILWYVLCALAFAWVLIKEKKAILGYLSPGLLLFLGASLFMLAALAVTKPLLTQWDEFTFWGTAAKATVSTNQLYTIAQSNLIARTYPPGLIVFNYAMQFFGTSFVEYKLMVSLCIVYFAAFAAAAAMLDKKRPAAILILTCMVLLPLFFESGTAQGDVSRAYLTCYSDPALAAVFGGGLALYFGSNKKDAWLGWLLAVVLAALTNIKDIGLALAALVVLVAFVDLIVCERERVAFYKLRGMHAIIAMATLWFAAIIGAYVLWTLHLRYGMPQAVNRFDIGASGQTLSQADMLIAGVLAVFGINRTEQFKQVTADMVYALVDKNRAVSLLGSGIVMLIVIAGLLLLCWLLAPTKKLRRRVVAFAISSFVGFVAYYVFLIFTYSFIFQPVEASVLKDYDRYIMPYWQGWLMGALVLLGGCVAANHTKKRHVWRPVACRAGALAVTAAFLLTVGWRGNWQANVLHVSTTLFSDRLYINNLVQQAEAEGMQPQDVVYILSQNDNGTHFYMLGFVMQASRVLVYSGTAISATGETVAIGNVAARLVNPEAIVGGNDVKCTPEILAAYLREQGVTGFLIDFMDDDFYQDYREMFSDTLAGWQPDGSNTGGLRYYQVVWQGDTCTFVPAQGGAGA